MSSSRRTACWRTPRNVMPDELKFEGDKQFFTAALDRADLILHGRNSYEDQPNSPQRKRIILTRKVDGDRARSVQSESHACGIRRARRSRPPAIMPACVPAPSPIIGGPDVFGMFMDRYDVFWLSQAPHVRLPGRRALLPRRARAFAAANPGRARPARRRSRRCSMPPTRSASRRGGATLRMN